MNAMNAVDSAQARLWNGPAGQAWVEAQVILDRMFEPLERMLVDTVVAASARHVLDIGCGTGATVLAACRALGPHAQCTGVDISAPMIAAACARADREGLAAAFICADAQVHAFEPAGADMIVSRFGVMFFDDPLAAFANLRRAARLGAGLRCLAWRSAAENPFMTTAERAAAPFLPALPARRPDGPGQFAFADPDRVRGILAGSGWTDIDIHPVDVALTLPEPDLMQYLTRLGPLGLVLDQAAEATRARIIQAVRAAFEPYVQGAAVVYAAALWSVAATAPFA